MKRDNLGKIGNDDYVEFEADSLEEAKLKALQFINSSGIGAHETKIVRPKISFNNVLTGLIFPVIAYAVILLTYFLLGYEMSIFIILLVSAFMLTIKHTTVLLILLYQKFASEELRGACLFTPSCSEYMILALNKYGFIIGLCKGIGRLWRCHPPNGGEDYP